MARQSESSFAWDVLRRSWGIRCDDRAKDRLLLTRPVALRSNG